MAQGATFFTALGKLVLPKTPPSGLPWETRLNMPVGVLFLCILPGFFLAWLLNSKLPGMTIFRGMFYIPVVASIVGSALVWFWIYNRDSGVLNTVIGSW